VPVLDSLLYIICGCVSGSRTFMSSRNGQNGEGDVVSVCVRVERKEKSWNRRVVCVVQVKGGGINAVGCDE
jgi:hypothetical protein